MTQYRGIKAALGSSKNEGRIGRWNGVHLKLNELTLLEQEGERGQLGKNKTRELLEERVMLSKREGH